MSQDLLERAHRLYALECAYLERLLGQEPAYAALCVRLETAEARLLAGAAVRSPRRPRLFRRPGACSWR